MNKWLNRAFLAGLLALLLAVPVGTECTVVLPSGEGKVLGSGEYTVTEKA